MQLSVSVLYIADALFSSITSVVLLYLLTLQYCLLYPPEQNRSKARRTVFPAAASTQFKCLLKSLLYRLVFRLSIVHWKIRKGNNYCQQFESIFNRLTTLPATLKDSFSVLLLNFPDKILHQCCSTVENYQYLRCLVTKGRLKLESRRYGLQTFIAFRIFIRFLQNKHCQLA